MVLFLCTLFSAPVLLIFRIFTKLSFCILFVGFPPSPLSYPPAYCIHLHVFIRIEVQVVLCYLKFVSFHRFCPLCLCWLCLFPILCIPCLFPDEVYFVSLLYERGIGIRHVPGCADYSSGSVLLRPSYFNKRDALIDAVFPCDSVLILGGLLLALFNMPVVFLVPCAPLPLFGVNTVFTRCFHLCLIHPACWFTFCTFCVNKHSACD